MLDEELAPTPEFHNVYVEPYAFRVYMETGKWPERSLIVKEFTFTSVDGKNCDGPPAYLCNAWFGKVIFQHGFTGIALMLKDSKRYPEDAGGWAYFTFGHQEPLIRRLQRSIRRSGARNVITTAQARNRTTCFP